MAQIGGYLTPDEHEEFKRYAAQFHLKDSSLANLLLARELRVRRLGALKDQFPPGPPLKERRRVTAHVPNEAVKRAFEAHAQEVGVSPNQGAAVLFRAELVQRWLERSITADHEESN
jgi:hypothetical protein